MGWTAPALARNLDRDPIRELHQGQRPYAPHERAGHMTAPDQVAKTMLKTLASGGRPHMSFALPLDRLNCSAETSTTAAPWSSAAIGPRREAPPRRKKPPRQR